MKSYTTFFLLIASIFSAFGASKEVEEINHLRVVADSLHSIGRTDSALIVGERAVVLADKSGDRLSIIGANSGQGVYLRSLGRIEDALKSYDKALAIATSADLRCNVTSEMAEEISTLYINLAVLNLDMQNKDEAQKNALSSAEWCGKSKDPVFKGTVYGVVGSVLTGCGDLENAKKYQSLAFSNSKEAEDMEGAFRAAAYTMLVADRLGDKEEAQRWREICVNSLSEIPSVMARLVYYQAECSICLKNNDDSGSLKWFKKIVEMPGIDNLPFVKFDAYNNMHLAYSNLGDYKEAYNALLESNALRDSLWQREKDESLRDLTVKYETKETQLALAQSEAKRSNILMWLFAALGLILVGVVFFILYVGRQRKIRLQKEIEFAKLRSEIGEEMTKQYIAGLESERARMSRELHDGVCNDLLAVELNMKNGLPIDRSISMLDACRESVRRISHELLPPEFAYASLDEVVKFYVNKQATANEGKINIRYHSVSNERSWDDVPDDVALEIYRIVQEALGNAVKHSGATEILVSLTFTPEDLRLEVNDNGTFKSESSNGIGRDSLRRRAASIKGEIEIKSEDKKGTSVILIVKTTENRN